MHWSRAARFIGAMFDPIIARVAEVPRASCMITRMVLFLFPSIFDVLAILSYQLFPKSMFSLRSLRLKDMHAAVGI